MDEPLEKPHSKNLRTYRRADGGGFYFITKSLEPKKRVIGPAMAEFICNSWLHYAGKGEIRLAAFVVMLDHWHLLLAPLNPEGIVMWMRKSVRWIGRNTNAELKRHGCVWQEGFYDTFIRTERQFFFVRHYIEANPVRANFVRESHEWEWSSAHPRW